MTSFVLRSYTPLKFFPEPIGQLTGQVAVSYTHLDVYKRQELDTHTGNDTIHITSDERTKWNDANNKKHTHSNKSVLDGITSELVQKWTETSSSSVTGIKGVNEDSFRRGNVEPVSYTHLFELCKKMKKQ